MEKILFSLHTMGAVFFNTPELMLDEQESKKLAKAIEGVNEQYKISLDPKTAAWIDLGTVASVIYGPRCLAIYFRATAKRGAPQPPPMNNGVNDPMRQPAPAKSPVNFDNMKIVNAPEDMKPN